METPVIHSKTLITSKKLLNKSASFSLLRSKKRLLSSSHLEPIIETPLDSVNPKNSSNLPPEKQFRSSKSLKIPHESIPHLEKSRQLTSKLLHALSKKSISQSTFQIYTDVFIELSDYLQEYKDLLLTLRSGLVISAIQEKDQKYFEFKLNFSNGLNEISDLLDKEKREKEKLAKKLNRISDEFIEMKEKYEFMSQKFAEYDLIVKNDAGKYIEAEKLVEKMMSQCKIIKRQQNLIYELQHNESRLRKILEICEQKGFVLEDSSKFPINSVLNPNITKVFKKSHTFSNAKSRIPDEF